MTGVDYIALSIPVFFALIGVEVLIARWRGEKLYRFNDSINDLSCGILQQVLGVFTKALIFGAYALIYQSAALLELDPRSWSVWVVCFLGVDFLYYWFHRVSHESNLPWGAHIVHHQSEEFNLAVALRQGAFQPLFSWVFYLPLAWIGFPPLVFLACSSFNTLYQFWIHTRLIGKLGPLEWVFNTPSHHRVHHGCDPKYIDKNYAGTLIVWDRLFGSFQVEEEEPTYGVTKPLANWNPVWANLDYYRDLLRLTAQAPTGRDRLKVWLKGPAWKPAWARLDAPERTPLSHGEAGKYDRSAPRNLGTYIWVHFLGLIGLTLLLLFQVDELDLAGKVGLGLLVAWTAANLGALFDRRRWVRLSELLRLAVVALAGVAALATSLDLPPATLALTIFAAALLFALFASWLLRRYHPTDPDPDPASPITPPSAETSHGV